VTEQDFGIPAEFELGPALHKIRCLQRTDDRSAFQQGNRPHGVGVAERCAVGTDRSIREVDHRIRQASHQEYINQIRAGETLVEGQQTIPGYRSSSLDFLVGIKRAERMFFTIERLIEFLHVAECPRIAPLAQFFNNAFALLLDDPALQSRLE